METPCIFKSAVERQWTEKGIQFQFQICTKLFEEYKSFQYDSAFKYTNKMLQLAFVLNDKAKITMRK